MCSARAEGFYNGTLGRDLSAARLKRDQCTQRLRDTIGSQAKDPRRLASIQLVNLKALRSAEQWVEAYHDAYRAALELQHEMDSQAITNAETGAKRAIRIAELTYFYRKILKRELGIEDDHARWIRLILEHLVLQNQQDGWTEALKAELGQQLSIAENQRRIYLREFHSACRKLRVARKALWDAQDQFGRHFNWIRVFVTKCLGCQEVEVQHRHSIPLDGMRTCERCRWQAWP